MMDRESCRGYDFWLTGSERSRQAISREQFKPPAKASQAKRRIWRRIRLTRRFHQCGGLSMMHESEIRASVSDYGELTAPIAAR